MARRSDISLSRSGICDAALELIETNGLEALTMRSLARSLRVQAPSLYSHYQDKSELMSDLAASYFLEARDSVIEWHSPEDWLFQFGLAFYRILTTKRDAARLFALSQPPVQSESARPEHAVRPLTDAGIGLHEAVEWQAAIVALSLGMALDHANPFTRSYLGGYFNLEHSLKTALAVLAAGLVTQSRAIGPAAGQ